MDISREEAQADLRQARIRKYVYFGAGIALLILAIVLVVMFFIRESKDWGALALAVAGVIFSLLMLNQARHTARIEAGIAKYESGLGDDGAPPGEKFIPAPTAQRLEEVGPGEAPSARSDEPEPDADAPGSSDDAGGVPDEP